MRGTDEQKHHEIDGGDQAVKVGVLHILCVAFVEAVNYCEENLHHDRNYSETFQRTIHAHLNSIR